jgi:hypothetical protein
VPRLAGFAFDLDAAQLGVIGGEAWEIGDGKQGAAGKADVLHLGDFVAEELGGVHDGEKGVTLLTGLT